MLTADPNESHLKYEPAPARPLGFDRRLKQIVDKCPTGDMYLRFSWGMDVTEVLDGHLIHRYPDPLGKNVGLDRWVLEGWQSPEVYDEVQWRQNEDILGPYPLQGVWDFIAIVQDEQKRYLPLGEKALQMARNWRHWRSKPRERVLEDLVKSRCELKVVEAKHKAERKQELLDTFVRDLANVEQGTYDPRNKTLIGKITKGAYQVSPTGILIPKLA